MTARTASIANLATIESEECDEMLKISSINLSPIDVSGPADLVDVVRNGASRFVRAAPLS